MSRITVVGGTGYAGSAVVTEAASRGHQVTAFSQNAPKTPVAGVTYVQGDAADRIALAAVLADAEVVVTALAPRGAFTAVFGDVTRSIAELADEAGARLFVVGGFSSLRPAPGADRFVSDLTHVPEAVRGEVLAGASLITEVLPATPESLSWVFVSPAKGFGSFAPREPLGRYELGDDVAVEPETGGALSVQDYALGLVDLIENDSRSRVHVNLGNPV